jgi:type II secretory pathway component PulM
MPFVRHIAPLRRRLRALLASGRALAAASFGLTPRERDGALLVAGLFVFGLAVQWLRWLCQGYHPS